MGNDKWLFVYGTLMRGEPRHHILEEHGAVMYSEAYTSKGYSLFDAGHYPMLVAGYNIGAPSVYGELYKVSNDLLEYLDQIEGVPYLYERCEIVVNTMVERFLADTYSVSPLKPFLNELPIIKANDWRLRDHPDYQGDDGEDEQELNL